MKTQRGILITATGSSAAYACGPAEHATLRRHPVLFNGTYCVAFGGDPNGVFPSDVLPPPLSLFVGYGETVFVYDPDGQDVDLDAFASPESTAPMEEEVSKEEDPPSRDEQEENDDDDNLSDVLLLSTSEEEEEDVVNDVEEEEEEEDSEEDSDDEDS